MNRVKSCKQLLIIFAAIFITNGYYGQELQKTSGKILKEGVINIITTLHGVMKQYVSLNCFNLLSFQNGTTICSVIF